MAILGGSEKETLIAAFDLTSSSVGGILFLHHPDKIPEIITASRFQTDFLPDLEFRKYERSLHKTFERNINHLKKFMPEGKKRPDSVMVTLFSPYYVSQSKIVRFTKSQPFEITHNLIESFVKEEAGAFKNQWQSRHPRASKENRDVEFIENEKMKMTLNGYNTNQPIGKRAKSGEIYLYVSLGIKSVEDKIKECINHSFGEIPVSFQSFSWVAYSAIKDIVHLGKGLLLIDIGGEITELILIRDGILEETISFPLGENFLVRRIASVFRFSPEESLALLSQYGREDLHGATKEKIQKITEEAATKWCQFFNDSLANNPEFLFLPQDILFIGGRAASVMKNFASCVKKGPFNSRFLLAEAFKNHFEFKKGFEEDKDILLMLQVFFADKFKSIQVN